MKTSTTYCSILLLVACFMSPVEAKIAYPAKYSEKNSELNKNCHTLSLNKVTPNFILANNSTLKIISLIAKPHKFSSWQTKKLLDQQFKQFNIIVSVDRSNLNKNNNNNLLQNYSKPRNAHH